MKKKYNVDLYFTTSASFTVNAETPDEALEIANEKVTELVKENKDNQIMHNLWHDDSATWVEEL